ncbi:hypothetical protein GCM10009547_10050 [Sporichthya brevicatena]|uniref:LPXTG-motif cell wall anchor domain-containing protein n=1 Tax=Sporichthya brevicatena TaxID=171442 RepID=A0ABP3RG70_9ACTN
MAGSVRRPLTTLAAGAVLAVTSAGTATAVDAPVALQPFGIAGSPADGFYPGASGVIDLELSNPNAVDLTLQDLTISLESVTPASGASGPCSAADFEIVQLSSVSGVVLAPGSSTRLSNLGVASADLPRFTMLNTTDNQDGCQGAVVTLRYAGTATAAEVGGVDRPPVEVPGSGGSDPRPTEPGPAGPRGPGEVGGVGLPGTGASVGVELLALGAGLVLLGAGTMTVTRRRRASA